MPHFSTNPPPDPVPSVTPPAAAQDSAESVDRDSLPNQGPVSGNRTPMVVTITVLAVMVLAMVVWAVAAAVG